ncbi:hypothetical protein ACQP1W_22005 [Spirillospora sp. CA-255316]
MAQTETSDGPQRLGWIGAIARRWPTWLAIALATVSSVGGEDSTQDTVHGFGEALPLLALGYLILAKLERRRATWLVVITALVSMTVLRALNLIPPVAVIIAVALVVLVWGTLGRRPEDKGLFRIQAIGMAGFAALAVTGLAVDPDLGRYVVAAGWFCHGVWDYVHLKLDKVVSRSFAEWCGLFDILIAAMLIFQS